MNKKEKKKKEKTEADLSFHSLGEPLATSLQHLRSSGHSVFAAAASVLSKCCSLTCGADLSLISHFSHLYIATTTK